MLWNARQTLKNNREQQRVARVLNDHLGLPQNSLHVLDYLRYCNDVGEYVEDEQVVSHYITFHDPQEWKYIDIDDLTDDLKIIGEVYGSDTDKSLVEDYIRFRHELPTNVPLNRVSEHFAMFCCVQEWDDWTLSHR